MSAFAELRAVLIRKAVGLEGFVREKEARAVLDWCGDLLAIRHSRFACRGGYARREDGGFLVTVPLCARDEDWLFRALHEAGHGFLDLPPREREFAPVRIGRLGYQAVARDERENEAFLDALRLPRAVLGRYLDVDDPDWAGLAEDSGCTTSEIERRLHWVRSHPKPPAGPAPPWSAVHHYELQERRTEYVRALVIRPRDGGPNLEFPVRNEAESRLLRNQLSGSLYALRPHEFRLKFRGDEARAADALVPWREWAGEELARWS